MRLTSLAWKNLQRRKARSLATVAGMAIAIGALISLVGLSENLRSTIQDLMSSHEVDLVVFKAGISQRITSVLDQGLGARIAEVPGVRRVMPALVDFATLENAGALGVPINGWEWDSTLFGELTIREGRLFRPADRRGVLIGYVVADRLGKHVGDEVEIELETFRVLGTFESLNVFENSSFVMPLPEMQDLLDRPGKVTGFAVTLERADDPSALAAEVRRRINDLRDEAGDRLPLDSMPMRDFIQSTNELGIIRGIAWMTSAIALLVSVSGIFNTMIMSVFERTAELGTLHAIGWRPRRIVGMVLLESGLLSLLGVAVGMPGALLVVRLLSRLQGFAVVLSGHISPWVLAEATALGLLVGTLGGLYPALRAGSMTPSEALRHV
jgi:putative ABC transport system permease protein